jgi:hypothetical protein
MLPMDTHWQVVCVGKYSCVRTNKSKKGKARETQKKRESRGIKVAKYRGIGCE